MRDSLIQHLIFISSHSRSLLLTAYILCIARQNYSNILIQCFLPSYKNKRAHKDREISFINSMKAIIIKVCIVKYYVKEFRDNCCNLSRCVVSAIVEKITLPIDLLDFFECIMIQYCTHISLSLKFVHTFRYMKLT